MNSRDISEEKLNLFIDEQLDTDEMNEIRQAMLDDKELRERVCQLNAVRELVGYAYNEVPESPYAGREAKNNNSILYKAIAACITLVAGVVLGWSTYEYSPNAIPAVTAENTFRYVANHANLDHHQRKIILHIDSDDKAIVNNALNEVDYLMATYHKANIPMKLEVVTNKTGINMLRPGVSPYIERIQKLIEDENVAVYACQVSLRKAAKKEGAEIKLLPGVTIDKTAKQIIPDRLKRGWVYIKA
jgi:intracellular sulfur oxidation DsrE/DsrF family protein